MLDRYLASPPTITEKLAILQTPKKIAKTDKMIEQKPRSFFANGKLAGRKAADTISIV
jgi:hypothetical protein